MTRAVLAFGSNLGDRYAHLKAAVAGLVDVLVAVSGVYETPPWGDPDQPAYLNAAALVAEEGTAPCGWLARGRALEHLAGRVRDPDRGYGPRTLDVDVIAVWTGAGGAIIHAGPGLTLPHPLAHVRAFVLRPWLDIDPYARLPGRGWVADLLRAEPVAGELAGLVPRPDLPLG